MYIDKIDDKWYIITEMPANYGVRWRCFDTFEEAAEMYHKKISDFIIMMKKHKYRRKQFEKWEYLKDRGLIRYSQWYYEKYIKKEDGE